MMNSIQIEFVGTLQKLAGTSRTSLEFQEEKTVRQVASELLELFTPEFKDFLIDPELNNPRSNVLLVLNQTEIGALNGLDTIVKDGDKLVLIPTSHGG